MMVEFDKTDSVLFVDDEQQILKTLKRIFINEPYQKHYCDKVEDALKLIEDVEINVLVSDLTMPGDGGLKFLRIINEQHPNIIRIVLTGQAVMPYSLQMQKDYPIFRYIVKPWSSDQELINTIRWAISYYKLIKYKITNMQPEKQNEEPVPVANDNEAPPIGVESNPDYEKLYQFLVTDINDFVQYCNSLISDKLNKYLEFSEFLNYKKHYNNIHNFFTKVLSEK